MDGRGYIPHGQIDSGNQAHLSHVFCSFLTLPLEAELERRMNFAGLQCEWAQVLRGLKALQQVEAIFQDKRFLLRRRRATHVAPVARTGRGREFSAKACYQFYKYPWTRHLQF
jgi:hypothetical protein